MWGWIALRERNGDVGCSSLLNPIWVLSPSQCNIQLSCCIWLNCCNLCCFIHLGCCIHLACCIHISCYIQPSYYVISVATMLVAISISAAMFTLVAICTLVATMCPPWLLYPPCSYVHLVDYHMSWLIPTVPFLKLERVPAAKTRFSCSRISYIQS